MEKVFRCKSCNVRKFYNDGHQYATVRLITWKESLLELLG